MSETRPHKEAFSAQQRWSVVRTAPDINFRFIVVGGTARSDTSCCTTSSTPDSSFDKKRQYLPHPTVLGVR